MHRIAIAAVIFLACLAPALADVRIAASGGGDVLAFLNFFALLKRSGERVVVDGPCLSACTLVLSEIPRERICVTPRAVLGFHAAQLLDIRTYRRYPAPEATQVLASTYPAQIRRWIDRHGGLTSKIIILRGQELASLYPRCS
jgi:hypothetical protein